MGKILAAVPILRVTDLDRSIDYYRDVLGFALDSVYRHDLEASDGYALLSRDGSKLHVSNFGGDGVVGQAVYFYVEEIDALHDEWRRAGAQILYDPAAAVEGPGDQPWKMRELYVKDPDGNVLRFGQRL